MGASERRQSNMPDNAVSLKTVWNRDPTVRLGGTTIGAAFGLSLISSLLSGIIPSWVALDLIGSLAALVMWFGVGVLFHGLISYTAEYGSTTQRGSLTRWSRWLALWQCEKRLILGIRDRMRVTASPVFPMHTRHRASQLQSVTSHRLVSIAWSGILLVYVVNGILWLSHNGLVAPVPAGLIVSPPLQTILLWMVGITLIHELLHALPAAWYGCTVSIGVRLPSSAFTRSSNAVLTRGQRLVVVLTPFVVLSLGGLALAVWGTGWISHLGLLILLVTVSGSSSDVLTAWRLGLLPRGSLVYHGPSGEGTTIFEPTDASSSILRAIQAYIYRTSLDLNTGNEDEQ